MPNTLRKNHIAIVDSDAAVSDSFAALLRTEGYHPRIYASLEALLQALPKAKSDCVILDTAAAGEADLAAACDHLVRDHHLPVILITGKIRPREMAGYNAWGIETLLEKPVSDQSLLKTVERVFGSQ